jgi:hypothetical protein
MTFTRIGGTSCTPCTTAVHLMPRSRWLWQSLQPAQSATTCEMIYRIATPRRPGIKATHKIKNTKESNGACAIEARAGNAACGALTLSQPLAS